MPMKRGGPPVQHREIVRGEWIDYNGHMNVAFFVLVFDHATDAMLETLTLGEVYRGASGHSVYILEAHVNYLAEVHEGQFIAVSTQLIDCDAKRLHYYHRMFRESDGVLAATTEQVLVHVDTTAGRSVPMPAAARREARRLAAAHAIYGVPEHHGRKIGLARPRNR